ncbi:MULTISPECIES: carboxypeptidase-like regulatory domain-containing protein [unclassified Corallococcus]|uniref:carboxypeptidase-like regulatory domain-containing protein n=1 Tax=unclassified Corallococcus TaxID=2685029 RepID=UPI001A8C20D1|nr:MULTISPECIES: carboxypeptidase-like regulatory domain-containing protein [unclassified Corallococcus]MBN9685064.1 carboxypeptidase regulatory-like domain-containing protein [Corallococcus sp. NCSPR001]WAS83477.1 carboxypeptidase-like regulatory domain-containing protein [Corallococcus sp. NCRR]
MLPIPHPVRSPGLVLACLLACAMGCAMSDLDAPFIHGGKADAFCTVDQDCGDPALFFCNTALSRCEPSCRTDLDCSVQRRGELNTIAACESQSLGCRCDASRCVPALCTGDRDCQDGELCRDGACGAPPPASTLAACHVVPAHVIAPVGTPLRFEAWVSDAAGQPVVPRDGLTWSAVSARVKGGGTGTGATFTLESAGAEVEAVEARLGTVACRASVTVLPPHTASGQVRVVVTDALTGHPVEGASVVVADTLGGVTASESTDAQGVAVLEARSDASVSVFHPDFGYLTVANYDMTGTRDLRLPLRRNPADRVGGVRARFTHLAPVGVGGALALGMAGLSVPGLLSESASAQVQGPDRDVDLSLRGLTRQFQLPANVWVNGLGVLPSESVDVPGIPGVCDAALADGTDPETATRAGTCGTRTAWALTAQVPSGELPAGMMNPSTDPLLLLARALPQSGRFSSAVQRDVRFPLYAPIDGMSPPAGPLTSLDFQQVPLAFPFVVRVPPLPRFRDSYLARALVVGSVSAPGRGTVPLGLGAAVNANPVDPNTDTQPLLSSPGLVRVRMAPAHHGLEGQAYRLVAVASSGALGGEEPVGQATSAVMTPLDALRFDPEGLQPVTLGNMFLGIPEGARYNPDTLPWHGLLPREWRMDGAPLGATLVRATFTNAAGRRWTVWVDSRRIANGVRLPVPPPGLEDRTFQGDTEGSRASLSVEALSVAMSEGQGMNLSALAETGGMAPERLAESVLAVSTLNQGRPQVTWLSPTEGASLARGATVRVRVDGFQVGTDAANGDEGGVLLTVRDGGPGCDFSVVRGDVATRSGEVALSVPVACSGAQVTLVASLVDGLGLPLRPAVRATRTVRVP